MGWGVGRTAGKVFVFLPCSHCCRVSLGWSSAEHKEDLPHHRGCGETKEPEALARPGDSWPLVRLLQ